MVYLLKMVIFHVEHRTSHGPWLRYQAVSTMARPRTCSPWMSAQEKADAPPPHGGYHVELGYEKSMKKQWKHRCKPWKIDKTHQKINKTPWNKQYQPWKIDDNHPRMGKHRGNVDENHGKVDKHYEVEIFDMDFLVVYIVYINSTKTQKHDIGAHSDSWSPRKERFFFHSSRHHAVAEPSTWMMTPRILND